MSDNNYSTPRAGLQPEMETNDFQVTIDFLKELRPPPWVLTAIIPDGHTTTITAHTVEEATAFLGRHNGKQNLYYTLNPTKTAMTKKPKKARSAPRKK